MAYDSTLRSDMRISAAADDGSTHGGFTWTATWIAVVVAGGGAGLLLLVGGSVVAFYYHRRRSNVLKIHSSEVALRQQQQPSTYAMHTTTAPVIMHVGYGNPASPHYTTGP